VSERTGLHDPVALCGASVVVSFDPPEVADGDLVLEHGRVLGFVPFPEGAVRRDCRGTVVVPGIVCAHHHLYSALARGMPYGLAAPSDFLEILQRVWWRLDRALDAESVRASATLGALEALRCGTTTIVDHHASPNFIDGSLDVIADALGALGARAVLCYEVTDRDGMGRAKAGIEENRRFLSASRPLARGMVGAHASFTMSNDTLAACADVARAFAAGIHIHVAEDAVDEDDSTARFGKRVVERLDEHGALDDRALLAHCVHVNEREIKLVESAGATVVCNPRSNMNNGVGHSPFTNRQGPVALGTDGIGGDLVAEAQAGFFRGREAALDLAYSWPLERLASSQRLVGRVYDEPLFGTLRPGAPADLAVIAYDPPTPFDAASLAGHFLFGWSSGRVRDVYVAGERVLADGRSTLVDEAELTHASHEAATRLWERLEAIPAHDYAPEGRRTR
jgi:putative selenium metabolism protein SsnA